jgi:hypothetical protein
MLRSLGKVVGLVALLATGCGEDAPTHLTPVPEGDGGRTNDGAAGNGGAVLFCNALVVIRDKCQRCHGDPVRNGAPVSFVTYPDTQEPYFTTDKKWWEVMLASVDEDVMPYVVLNDGPNPIKPPVEPLNMDEKATLLGWLEQGAKPEGGTVCP